MTTESPGPGSGLVVVDKPSDWTSHDVVARVRRLAGTRKVGHAGTLDPMATGVLVVGVNRATRLLGHVAGADKEYLATIALGATTVTDDAQGDETGSADASSLGAEAVREAMLPLTGAIDQVPSAVSAIKVDGKRSYARVRSGEQVELKARRVEVATFELISFTPGVRAEAQVRVECSSGTYVRALARDLGAALGVGGHLTSLRRTRVGRFGLEQARTLDQLAESFDMVGLDVAARASFAPVDLTQEQAQAVRFGRALPDLVVPEGRPVAVFAPDGAFLALYEAAGAGARPLAVFV
ncbi:tRNA pseudouridine synthase B [Aeromicrobium flavum]|uniref:tRNA pseudouridine synthase B n=1 Tax=Aeromicrobium flavum TaxID=416568 RepID=A0A512HWV2_9ACTN|nr:tRNA pseudouridine(55) synthase TruB [Aeromicrobium flavum]GEO89926.1 tRNA pseudouridine synthase B [Aeromicrobium flavum]